MTDRPILHSTTNGIIRITLNRPSRYNALTKEMMLDLNKIVRGAISDPDTNVILLCGAGRGFCAGQDLSERDPRGRQSPFDLETAQIELFHPVICALTETSIPVVAAVNGIASGAGAGLALAADITIVGRSAKFAFSFSKIGLSVDAGLGLALTLRLGPARARAMLMLGETLTGAQAENLGVVWKCVADDALNHETDALVEKLSATPKMSLSGIKATVAAAASGLDFKSYLAVEAHHQGMAGSHPDYAEGVLSFLEKRAPNFRKN